MVGADHRDHVLLRDQAERLALALVGLALVVGAQALDLRSAEVGESTADLPAFAAFPDNG